MQFSLAARVIPAIAAPDVRSRRSRRVIVLLCGVIVLSLADLIVTLTHLETVGMVEANPIAAFLIESTRSPWVLTAYKTLTVVVCVSLLYRVRRYLEGEIAAWGALAILVGLSLLWHCYSEAVDSPITVQLVQAQNGERWLHLD